MRIIQVFTGDFLILSDSATCRPIGQVVGDTLVWGESARSGLITKSVSDNLNLQESASVGSNKTQIASDTLSLSESAFPRVFDVTAYDPLILWENPNLPNDVLTLEETASVTRSRGSQDVLRLRESATFTNDRLLSPEDTLTFVEGALVFKNDRDYIGDASLLASFPNILIEHRGRQYVIDNPILGNSENVEFLRINRETLGGDLSVYRPDHWPKIEVHTLNFDVCKQKMMDDIRKLINLSLGEYIEYRDMEGRWWDALIINPDTAIAQNGRHKYTVMLQLEVTLQ